MTAIRPETPVDILEAYAWEIPCERATREVSDHPSVPCHGTGVAEWAMVASCACPPGVLLYCTLCKDWVLAYDGALACESCHQWWSPGRLAYRRIEPINRGRRAA